jgi:toxin ParE1/3/4
LTIRLKASARADLAAIRVWSEDNWGLARTRDYLSGLKLALEQLDRNPLFGRTREVFATGLRSWTYKVHIMFYVVLDDGISIVRVLHERRNHAALDFSEIVEGDA